MKINNKNNINLRARNIAFTLLFFLFCTPINSQSGLELTLTGMLEKGHYDLNNGLIENVYFLKTDAKVYTLRFNVLLNKYSNGDKVKIIGSLITNTILIETISLIESSNNNLLFKKTGDSNPTDTIKAAIIPFYYSDG